MSDVLGEYARLRQEFRDKGFGARVGFGQRPALLAVDTEVPERVVDARLPRRGVDGE